MNPNRLEKVSDGRYYLSVITVCYNAFDVIEATISSVISQDHRELLEFIVIDGQSNDATADILNRYSDKIDQLIIEPDRGIYDAMNKGLHLAQGDYILYMNAGDYINSSNLITQMKQSAQADIYYSDTILINDQSIKLGLRSELTTRTIPDTLDKDSFRRGLVVSHQSFIPRRSIASEYIDNNLSADIDWIITCVSKSNKALKLAEPISCFLVGGISDQKKMKSLVDRFKVMVTHYGLIQTIFIHLKFVIRLLNKRPKYR